jgi:hypothetical protein
VILGDVWLPSGPSGCEQVIAVSPVNDCLCVNAALSLASRRRLSAPNANRGSVKSYGDLRDA